MYPKVGCLFILLLFQLTASSKKEELVNCLDELIDSEKAVVFESFPGGKRDWELEDAIFNITQKEEPHPIPELVVGKAATTSLVIIFGCFFLTFIIWLRLRNTMDFDLPNDIIYERSLPYNYDLISQYMTTFHSSTTTDGLDSVFREYTTGTDFYEMPSKLFHLDFVPPKGIKSLEEKNNLIKPLIEKHRNEFKGELEKIKEEEKKEEAAKKAQATNKKENKEEANNNEKWKLAYDAVIQKFRNKAWEDYFDKHEKGNDIGRKSRQKMLRGNVPRYQMK